LKKSSRLRKRSTWRASRIWPGSWPHCVSAADGFFSYGIIGFFVALQSLLTILDRGFSATLNRELARRPDAAAGADDTRD
jgi:hypothetical protein